VLTCIIQAAITFIQLTDCSVFTLINHSLYGDLLSHFIGWMICATA